MRNLASIFVLITLLCFSCQEQRKTITGQTLTLPEFSVIDTKFPLNLSELNLQTEEDLIQLNDGIVAKIEMTIYSFYLNECSGDSSETYFKLKDSFIGALRLQDKSWTIFVVLFKHLPGGQVNSKLLFYNNFSKYFIEKPLDFNIHALYDFENGKLKPSNLKNQLKINTPEIERVNCEADGESKFRLTRLYHNGTANAIETLVLKVADNNVDTVDFNRKWIGNGTEKP